MEHKLKILFLEDSSADLELMLYQLKRDKINFKYKCVDHKQDYIIVLKEFNPDIILADYTLVDFNGLEALEILKGQSPQTPLILITGTLSDVDAVETIKAGAWDYVLKDRMSRLGSAIKNAISLRDETNDKQKAEEKLKKSELLFRSLFETSNDTILLIREGKVFECNEMSSQMFDLSKQEIIGKELFEVSPAIQNTGNSSKESINEKLNLAINGEPQFFEWTFFRNDVTTFEAEVSLNKVLLENEIFVQAIIRDISMRKKIEYALKKNEEKYYSLYSMLRAIADNVPDMIWAKDMDKKFIFTNKATCDKLLIAEDVQEPIGKSADYFVNIQKNKYPDNPEWYTFGEQGVDSDDIVMLNREAQRFEEYGNINGKFVYLDVNKAPLLNQQREMIGTVCCARIVTKQKEIEKELKESLNEKEVLLKEIHHRVKNNMQIVSSILKLQARHIEDEVALSLFRNSQDRVKTMALIHERLYLSENLSDIDFNKYVNSLIRYLCSTYDVNVNKIKINVDIPDFKLNINMAIPCGLIINELVTNSIKYAFPGDRMGIINISMIKEEDKYTLLVSDNGIGFDFDEDIDVDKIESLGLELVKNLTIQLSGNLKIERDNGVRFIISFWDSLVKDNL